MTDFNEILDYQSNLKAKTNLSQKIMDDMTLILDQKEGPELYSFLITANKELMPSIKQATCEWIRTKKDEDYLNERVAYLRYVRDNTRKSDLVRCFATLAMMRCGFFDWEIAIPILDQWFTKISQNKPLSRKLYSIFEDTNLPAAIEILKSLKSCLVLIELASLDEIKKRVSELLRKTVITDDAMRELKNELNSLRDLMNSEYWLQSAKDHMLMQNIERVFIRIEESQKKREEIEDLGTVDSVELQEKDDSIEFEKKEDRITPTTKEMKSIVHDALTQNQKDLIRGIKDEFISINRRIIQRETQLKRNTEGYKQLERDKASLESMANKYAEKNNELEKKVELLRNRLEEATERLEAKSRDWEFGKKSLQERILDLNNKNQELEAKLAELQNELKRVDHLSHSTLQDAKIRANMAVQEKIDSINGILRPILKEVDEFEEIADTLPDRARMLLNILNKLKAALKMNGVLT